MRRGRGGRLRWGRWLAAAISVFVAACAGYDKDTADEESVATRADGVGAVCGGFAGSLCGAFEYCDFPAGARCGFADQTGICRSRPQGCTRDCPGVCGCDGQFYCNACVAASAGVDVDPQGTCSRRRITCGGPARTPCDPGQYCDYSGRRGCAVPTRRGICRPAPDVCSQDCPGVCGCDGQFYCNACLAARSGTDVNPEDISCSPPQVRTCGGLLGLTCEQDEYCDFPDDAFCGAADQTGVCRARPETCTQDCPGACGCDDKFYCNACIAAQSGVDVSPGATCTP